MSISSDQLRRIVEAAMLAAAKPLSISQLQALFDDDEKPSKAEFEAAFEDIHNDCEGRGFELLEVANGWRFQVRQDLSPWVGRLWEEKPQKYSRAMLETLALVAYRQPITRGEIEEIRGVAVSSHIMKTLMERNWVKVVGHRDVPGRPAMYATTKDFLDYFSMSSLEDLPTLAEIRDLDSLNQELNLEANSAGAANDASNDTVDEEDAEKQAAADLLSIDHDNDHDNDSEPSSADSEVVDNTGFDGELSDNGDAIDGDAIDDDVMQESSEDQSLNDEDTDENEHADTVDPDPHVPEASLEDHNETSENSSNDEGISSFD